MRWHAHAAGAPRPDPRHSTKLVLCLATVYLVWGSSFLFSKIAVTHLPAALFSGVRFITAGTVLALIARYGSGAAWPAARGEWRHVFILGLFMVFVSNGLNIWAIRFIPTNQSALLNGTAAFWIAGLGMFGPRGHKPTRRALAGLAIGFLGTALMLLPKGPVGGLPMAAQSAALGGCLAWSLGTLYCRSADSKLRPLMATAFQMLIGGAMLLGLGLANGDAGRWTLDAAGLTSLLYLTVCSSCLAYSAYAWLTLNTTPTLIGTYSYVNPAIAALLGWQFLDEQLSPVQMAGAAVIIVGVLMLTLPGGSRPREPQPRLTIT